MSAYTDTSAQSKCYIRKPRSQDVVDWADAEGPVATWRLTLVKFRCLLARRRRAGQIEPPLERSGLTEFDRDLQARNWLITPESAGLYHEARQFIDLIPEIALHTLDALHLAHARHYGARDFATADRNQEKAARALGFNTHLFY